MSDHANHIDYRLNEITGDRRTLIEVSKLPRNSFRPLALRRRRDGSAGGMTTKLLLCTQCEVNLQLPPVPATVTGGRGGGARAGENTTHGFASDLIL